MYIRFVYETQYDKGLSAGLFTGANELMTDGVLESYEKECVVEIFQWYKKYLPVPPWKEKGFHWAAVSWFKEEAIEFINKMWELVRILKNHDVSVQVMKTENPGLILYSDEYQVVAVTPRLTDCNFKKTRA